MNFHIDELYRDKNPRPDLEFPTCSVRLWENFLDSNWLKAHHHQEDEIYFLYAKRCRQALKNNIPLYLSPFDEFGEDLLSFRQHKLEYLLPQLADRDGLWTVEVDSSNKSDAYEVPGSIGVRATLLRHSNETKLKEFLEKRKKIEEIEYVKRVDENLNMFLGSHP